MNESESDLRELKSVFTFKQNGCCVLENVYNENGLYAKWFVIQTKILDFESLGVSIYAYIGQISYLHGGPGGVIPGPPIQ
jgi:hypothetical protein